MRERNARKQLLRLMAFCVAVLLFFSLVSCGNDESASSDGSSSSVSDAVDGDVNAPDVESTDAVQQPTTTVRKTSTATKTQKTTEPTLYTPTLDEPFEEVSSKPVRPNTPWEQSGFYISTFKGLANDYGSVYDYIACIEAHKEAGFNLVENAIMGRSDSLKAAQACEEAGMPFLIQNISTPYGFSGMGSSCPDFDSALIRQIVKEMIGYKYLEGYYTWDEVVPTYFSKCKYLNDLFYYYDPGSLAFSLVLPSYGSFRWDNADDMTKSSYYKYVTEYVEKVKPKVLSFDYYPFQQHGGDKLDLKGDCMLWQDMGLFRKLSMEKDIPFWFYFQAYNMDQGYHFTNEMRSVQMYYAIAYGAKCVSYFSTIGVLVEKDGDKLDDFNGIKALNKKVMNLGSYLFKKETEELYQFGYSEKLRTLYQLDDPADSDLISSATDGTIVGVFGDGSAKKYVLVVNKDYKKALTGTLTLKNAKKVKLYQHQNNKTTTVSNSTKSISFNIPAGECALYIIE